MTRRLTVPALLLAIFLFVPAVAQQAPDNAPDKPKSYASYDELFDDFDERRQVLLTRYDRLQQNESVKPSELQAVEDDLKKLDGEYADALDTYTRANPNADDLMPARFERVVALSRLEDRLEDAIRAADDFLKTHDDSELAGDVRFLKGQSLFQIEGREEDTLRAFDEFLEEHPGRFDSDAARMMRIRTLMFLDRVDEVKREYRRLLDAERVKDDDDAKAFIQLQRDNLDWIGRELPDFTRRTVEGKDVSKGDFAGKPLLIYVWDSTSGAALGELPFVQEAYRKHKDDLNFLGISVNESRPALEQWLARNEDAVQFPTVWIDRDEENSLIKKLDVTLIPFLILADATGEIYRYDVRSDDMLRYAGLMTE